MNTAPDGIKKQVLGGVLCLLGVITALLSRFIGFELDVFYVVISVIGACLMLYGTLQRNRFKWKKWWMSTNGD